MQILAGLGLLFATGTSLDILLQFALGAAAVFLFVGRIVSRPYRGLAIVVTASGAEPSGRLTLHQRFHLWAFLWWRQILAGVLAGFPTLPLNAVLGIMGLNSRSGSESPAECW